MKTNILTLAITLTIGVILAGSLMMPVISEAQKDIGPITIVNNDTNVLLRPAEPGDILAVEFSDDKWVWSLNGEEVVGVGDQSIYWDSFVISDACYISGRDAGATWAATLTAFTVNPTSSTGGYTNKSYPEPPSTITFGTDTITITGNNGSIWQSGTDLVLPYTWAYVICPEVDATYKAASANGSGYVSSTDDLILCGVYTSGDNDCSYIYKNGTGEIFGANYTYEVTQTLALKEGTTDIYETSVSVAIGDETFTPYRIFVPYQISGHIAGGPEYELLGVIPIIVIIGLVLAAIGAIVSKRND